VNLLDPGRSLSASALFCIKEVNRLENPRPEKVAVVEEVRTKLDSSSAAILTEYRGLKVKELADLRRSLRAVGGDYKIYKNTLVRFAARDLGLDELEALLEGPTAIAFVEGDAVDVAKALRDFARTNPNLVVKGGVLGSSILSAKDAGALADLPSREVLLARIAGGLAAPMVQFAGLLQALPRNFAYGLKALIDQGGAPGAPADAPAAPEAAAAELEAAAAEPEASAAEPTAGEPEAATDAATEAAEPAAEAPEAAAPEAPEAEAPAAEEAAPSEQSGAGDATAGADVATAVVEGEAEPTADAAVEPQAAVAETTNETEAPGAEQEQE
jgi:large subunit ribosomal protein L10